MVVVVLLLLIGAGITIFAWSSRPFVIESSPKAGEVNVSASSSIRLVFSRSMDHDSVDARLKIEPATEGEHSWEKNSLVFVPNEPWQNGQKITLHLEAGARASSWLTFSMGGQSWSFTTSDASLAYLWPSNGPAEIYSLDPVSGVIQQYTQGMDILDYSASRDGKLFYVSASNAQEGADLYRIDRIKAVSSTDISYLPEKLLDCGAAQCRNPVVSSDDLTLAYEYLIPTPTGGLGPAQIWTLSLTTLDATQAGRTGDETVQPAWSPTGLLAYYDRTLNGYEVLNLVTQERVLLTNQTGQPGAWSMDGKYYLAPEITYQQAQGNYETGASHLMRYQIQNNASEDISGDGAVEDVEAIHSPDGELIAFTRKFLDAEHWTLGRQVWIMNDDGSNPHPITAEADYNHYDLAWSRDGLELAYERFNQAKISDPPELWIENVDGTDPVQLVIGGYSPIWIP